MKKLIALLACLILVTHLTSCTSKDSKDDSNGDQAVSDSVNPDADLDKTDAPAATADSTATADTNGGGANEGFLDDQLPADALGESTAKNDQTPPAPTDAVTDATTPPPANDAATTPDASAPPIADTATPPVDSSASVDTGTPPAVDQPPLDTTSSSTVASTEPTAPATDKPKASLKKVEATPMNREGVLLNAVYVARPGDTFKSVSKTIYGNGDKAKELKKVNASLKPRVGDKIYYNSPTRPTDDTKVLTYYEDAGLTPEVYVAKDGDDLKKVSKNLLGFDNAWKEVWVTNAVEPKGRLTAGTELRYWKGAPVAAPVTPPPADLAMNNPPPPAQADLPPPPAQAAAVEQAPPPPAQADLPPPPPPADMNAAPPPPPPAQADLPPPPPAEAVNPPPPPPVAKKAPKETVAPEGGMDNDMMMSLAGAGIIAAGLAAVIIIRKRRAQKDMSSAFNDTQVGT